MLFTGQYHDWYCPSCLASIFPFNQFDNDIDFFFALYDFSLQSNLMLNYLNKRNLIPFFVDTEKSHLLMNSNLDPGTNFFAANSQLLSNRPLSYLYWIQLINCHRSLMIHSPHFILMSVVYQNTLMNCERFEPRSHFKSRLSLIVRVNVSPE